jgi:transcription termination/antitermination protein NusA
MSKALIAGINQVATDKGLDREIIFEAIEAALISAYKRNYGSVANVGAEVDRVSGEMHVLTEREVVDDVMNPRTEILEDDARKLVPTARVGDVIRVPDTPDNFGRIAAQTAKQVILQRIREAERDTVYENFSHKVGEVITAQVRSIDTQSGAVSLMLDDKHECLMMREDQIAVEKLRRGEYVKVYVVDVHKSTRGPVIKISRTHRNLLRRLMEMEIPEVRDGIVEIKSIAREPGARSKAAVVATVPGVDPVGSCVGMRGLRIQNIVNELAGEKIDVIEWNSDSATYIQNALSPAKVQTVLLDDGTPIKTATVVVPDRQLSLAIGKEGQNARLAAKLTGWRIDIKSESEARDEGIDRVIVERAQQAAMKATDDLLAKAERILRRDDESSDDKLWQAAQALRDLDTIGGERPDVLPADFKSFEELVEGIEELPAPKTFGEAAFEDQEAIEGPPAEIEANVAWPPVAPDEPVAPISESAFSEEEAPSAAPPGSEELPEVITADMLRARMARRKEAGFNEQDIEVPAELLAGIDEEGLLEDEEWIDEAMGARGGKRKKAKGTPAKGAPKTDKKKAPKKRGWGDDEEFTW